MTSDGENRAPVPAGDAPLSPERRAFVVRVSLGLMGLAAALVAVPVVGFLIGPLIRKFPDIWRPIGKAESYAIGKTVLVSFRDPSPLAWAGVTAETAAWLRRDASGEFTAFAVNCTHLGCPVDGCRTRTCSCAHAMAECTTPTGRSRADLRRVRCSSIR